MWNKQYERMKVEYKEELGRNKRYLMEKIEEIENETIRIKNDKGNIDTKVDANILNNIDEINKLKVLIEDDQRTLAIKDKEIETKQQVVQQQENSIKATEQQIKDLENDMDFIEMSYQMQKDKAAKNERVKGELADIIDKLKQLVW